MIERNLIINLFNMLSSEMLDSENEEIFLSSVMDFEFTSEDKLCTCLKLLISTLNNSISIMDLHFTYTVNGKGFDNAKKDYFDKCIGK